MRKGIFITATDTEAGKTVTSLALLTWLKKKGINAGYFKPLQCSGEDAQFIKDKLCLSDSLRLINPLFSKTPAAPYIAFKNINLDKVFDAFKKLSEKYEFVIVEGAGGVLTPIKKNYLIVDLVRDLGLDCLVISPLKLGAINHTLLTLEQLKDNGVGVCGIVINQISPKPSSIISNEKIIREFSNLPVVGRIGYLQKKCFFDINQIIKEKNPENNLSKLDKKYVWHPFTQMKDWQKEDNLIIDEARGNYLKDIKGKWYLDGVSSLWVNVHGHRHPEINRAITEQLNKIEHSTLLGLGNVPSIRLAEKLVTIAPGKLNKVFYSDSGSTAVEIALKIAYQYWCNIGIKNKQKIIHFSSSYHGDTLGAVSVGGMDLFHKIYKPLLFNSIQIQAPIRIVCLDRLERFIKANHSSIAALITEPGIEAAAGMIVWQKGVLKKIENLCKKYNIIFIVDEVATGFGRTGKMFACEHENIKPDIMCIAKGLTGGYLALAATLTTDKIYNAFLANYKDQKTFFHGHTYTGNPLACSAALANLDVFKKEKTLLNLQSKIKLLKKRLKDFYKLSHVSDIRQFGFMVGIELAPYRWEDKIGIKVCQRIREKNIILRPLGNVIVLMHPLSITKSELNYLLDSVYWAIREITER